MTKFDMPLITLALVAYKQEKYITEAVNSAFAQTYSPLEIILSDDCSSDSTFEIMQEMASNYNGPHKIILNRNSQNLNIGGHLNIINQLANGEIVVAAAGDDISEPNRVTEIVNAWLHSAKKSVLIHSACRLIDSDSNQGELLHCPFSNSLDDISIVALKNAFVIGATEAWHRSLFEKFSEMRSDLVHEDRMLPFRALLLGGKITYIPQPLVSYRQGVGVSAQYVSAHSKTHLGPDVRKKVLNRFLIDYLQKKSDLLVISNSTVMKIVDQKIMEYQVALRFEDGLPKFSEWMGICEGIGYLFFFKMIIKKIKNLFGDKYCGTK